MAFNKFSGGGKKGPRAHNGGKKVKGVKLRPAPERPLLDASRDSASSKSKEKGKEKEVVPLPEEDDEGENGEQEETDEFGYKEGLRSERKPLEGVVVTVTGCQQTKLGLFETARELGASTDYAMTAVTTHVIADAQVRNSAKLKVRDPSPHI